MSSIMMSKQLGEFLQEQQEPFVLELYLLERGYSNVGSVLKRSVSSGLKRNRTFIPNCSRFVRGLFSKLVATTVGDDAANHKNNNDFAGRREKSFSNSSSSSSSKETGDDDNFSSASSATIFNSCSETDAEDACYYSSRKDNMLETADYYNSSENEVGEDDLLRWSRIKLSPVSVLDTESNHASLFHEKNGDARRKQFQFSALLNAYNKLEKPYWRSDQASSATSSSSQYNRNKKVLKQTEQLLIDCAREIVERVKKGSRTDLPSPQVLGSDQIWEIICGNISSWSREPINETNTSRLVHFDMVASGQEWSKFEQDTEELGTLIADAILEDTIRTEINLCKY